MHAHSLKRHLRPYSIHGRRATTVAHAFASAIAPVEPWDEKRVEAALQALGQQDVTNVRCVYCGSPGETWDHLVALVQGKRFSGYGHTLGNLVPACRACNSRKGNREWRTWVAAQPNGQRTVQLLERYAASFGGYSRSHDEMKLRHPNEFQELEDLNGQILRLMKRADEVAARIRAAETQ